MLRTGHRQDLALALAGILAKSGVAEGDALAVLDAITAQAGDDEPEKRAAALLATYEKHRDGLAVAGWSMMTGLLGDGTYAALQAALPRQDGPEFALSDVGNADRFVARHGERVRFVHQWNQWLVWDGAHLAPSRTGAVHPRRGGPGGA
ncbi:MAG TPA: hypothetical protein VFL91_28650 [Thermomicrobiales bacterium]|nr:hypothetical protein [Thermomicrobiales bacterium]